MFIFENKSDVERVLRNEPWSFDKHVIVLQYFNKILPLRDVVFKETVFWVQVHDIPITYMNQATAEELCASIGEVIHVPGSSTLGGQGFMRVWVRVDVTQPLCHGRVVTLENGKQSWVAFKYERLPILCYWCGCLDHADKDCEAWIQSNGTLKLKDKRYDSSIRALPFYPSSKNSVCVPGYFETQKQKIKERATFTMKSNRRGESDVQCRQQKKPEKEGAPSPDDFNADLNPDKPVSPPIFQSQHEAVNDDTINPINSKRTSRDSDLHGVSQHEDTVLDDTVESTGCNNARVGLSPTSLGNKKGPLVRPGLVSEFSAKWVRMAQPNNHYVEVKNAAQLGKRHVEASSSEHPEAKHRLQQNEASQPLSFSTVEAAQQPRRIQ